MKYYAFISYNKEDEKWAKWLHRSIERYHIPSRLKIDTKRLKPIFLDREELPAAPSLSNKIKEALEQSKYLIVICSPQSAKSDWVNNEISEFIRLGHRNRILCAIVRGEPYVKPDESGISSSEECIPKALRFELDNKEKISEHITLAADLRPGKDGKRKTLLKLIAAIIGVDFDALNRRDQKRRNQQRVISASIFLLLSALSAARVWKWLNFERETTSYYTSAYRQWGEYVGIGPVSENEFKNRDLVLRFIREGWKGKLNSVEKINSKKKLTVTLGPPIATYLPKMHPDGVLENQVVRIEYKRDSEGRLMEEVGFNENYKTVYTLDFIKPKLPPIRTRAAFNTEEGRDARTESAAAIVEFLRYPEGIKKGLDFEINFYDLEGKTPKPDNQGIYGQRLEYNESKLPARIVFVGKDGKPSRAEGTNISTTVLTYNKLGQLTVIEMVDESSQSTSSESNENDIVKTKYDKAGNIEQMIAKVNANGIPTESKMIFQKGIMRETVSTIFSANKIVLRSFLDSRMQIGVTDDGISSITAVYNTDNQVPQVTIMRLSTNPHDKKVEKLSKSGIKLPNLEKVPCVVIDEIISESVAANVGMKSGDLIVRYGGKDTPNADTLVQFTEDSNWPEEVEVIVVREIEILTFSVPPGRLGVHVSDN